MAFFHSSNCGRRNCRQRVLITGGAGFIGSNLADRLLSAGVPVVIFDNLSAPGGLENVRWLRDRHPEHNLHVEVADIRNRDALRRSMRGVGHIFHLAAQVSVMQSLCAPREDFEVNAGGTVNLIEEARALEPKPSVVFASTTKVYGSLPDLALQLNGMRYEPENSGLRARGIPENRPLDFNTPHACSKGAADQYVLDSARNLGIRATVLRFGSVYGPRQCGTGEHDWLGYILRRALSGEEILIHGDGRQVRDCLFVEDAVGALLHAWEHIDGLSGSAYNVGGGPKNSISLLELLDQVEKLTGQRPAVRFDSPRPGDAVYFVSDTRRFQQASGWRMKVDLRQGLQVLRDWLMEAGRIPAAAKAGESAELENVAS